jgi:hypothetical protein
LIFIISIIGTIIILPERRVFLPDSISDST